MPCLFFYHHDDEFPEETNKVSQKQSVPQSKKHQCKEMWQVLVAKETKAFKDVPTESNEKQFNVLTYSSRILRVYNLYITLYMHIVLRWVEG